MNDIFTFQKKIAEPRFLIYFTHGLTDLSCQINKIEIKPYTTLQSVLLLTEFFLVIPFACKGNHFIYFKSRHCILYYLDFYNNAKVGGPWEFLVLVCVCVRGEGTGWLGEPLWAHNKEILLFVDALRISKGQVVISLCESQPWTAAACGKGSLDFIYRKINNVPLLYKEAPKFSILYILEATKLVSANLISHTFWGNTHTHICTYT